MPRSLYQKTHTGKYSTAAGGKYASYAWDIIHNRQEKTLTLTDTVWRLTAGMAASGTPREKQLFNNYFSFISSGNFKYKRMFL
jgi:hypothetical protein